MPSMMYCGENGTIKRKGLARFRANPFTASGYQVLFDNLLNPESFTVCHQRRPCWYWHRRP